MQDGPHNEMQPVIDRMEDGDGERVQEWTADGYAEWLQRMDDLGIDGMDMD